MSATTVRRRPWWTRGIRFALGLARIKAVYVAKLVYYRLKWVEIEVVYFAQVAATYVLGFVAATLGLISGELSASVHARIAPWILGWGRE